MSHPTPTAFLALLAVAACGFTSEPFADCDFTQSHSAVLEADGADRARVEAGAGSLRIEGGPDISEVQVEGEACASSSEILERIRVTAVREGGEILVRAELPERDGSLLSGGDEEARLDLIIRVPESLSLDVEDESGSTEIRNTADVRLDDGSGSVLIEDVGGGLELRDGSGSLGVARVAGDVELDDGSGSIDLREIRGSVELRDGSGSIGIESVEGSVMILSDGSGSIRASDVRGDFVVEDDGSGSIGVSRIGGDFVVEEAGSGGIEFEDVSGAVRIPPED